MAKRAARQEGRRRLPEPEPLPRIPPRGATLPAVPPTIPPQVPSSALEGLAQQQVGRQPLISVSPQLANISQRIADFFSKIPGPGASPQQIAAPFAGIRGPGYNFLGGAQAPAPITEADLPQAGLAQAGLPGIGGGPAARIARRGGPQQLEGRRFFTIVSAITRGVRPPLITFEAQQYLGYSHDDMKDRLGYELTAGGWVRRPVTGTVVDAYLGGDGTGNGVVDFTLPSLPTYGGGSQRLSRSGLINWRI